KSSLKRPLPVTSRASSARRTGLPMKRNSGLFSMLGPWGSEDVDGRNRSGHGIGAGNLLARPGARKFQAGTGGHAAPISPLGIPESRRWPVHLTEPDGFSSTRGSGGRPLFHAGSRAEPNRERCI